MIVSERITAVTLISIITRAREKVQRNGGESGEIFHKDGKKGAYFRLHALFTPLQWWDISIIFVPAQGHLRVRKHLPYARGFTSCTFLR